MAAGDILRSLGFGEQEIQNLGNQVFAIEQRIIDEEGGNFGGTVAPPPAGTATPQVKCTSTALYECNH